MDLMKCEGVKDAKTGSGTCKKCGQCARYMTQLDEYGAVWGEYTKDAVMKDGQVESCEWYVEYSKEIYG